MARATEPVHHNVGQWVQANEKFFLPPVCNKMMHNTQLKVFYVGGPNQRKDYHLEEGEELFFMRKGNMNLKIMEGGKFRDVIIKEGEVFLLPAKIPHSPQREAKTVGLVIERDRVLGEELDGLRYFVDGTTESLFERWFYCDDLGAQLGPVIKEFFASEQCRTGKPIPEDIPANPPWTPDSDRRIEPPFPLKEWLDGNMTRLRTSGSVRMFDALRYQSDIMVLGRGPGASRNLKSAGGETFLWQVRGSSQVELAGKTYNLETDDTLLIPEESEFAFSSQEDTCACLSTLMNPRNKKRLVNL